MGLSWIWELIHYLHVNPVWKAKWPKYPSKVKGDHVKEVLELVQSDICGPMNIQVCGGYEYYVTFIDDYSKYGYVYQMHHKNETFEKFKEYRVEVEKQIGKLIKALQSD